MARSIDVIYNEIITEKQTLSSLVALQPNVDNAQALLANLTTTSKVARWRLYYWVVAFVTWSLETLFDNHKIEVENIIAASQPGTALWYRDRALEFQLGDSLSLIDNKWQYAVKDATKQIIKQCAVIDSNKAIIKIATADANNNFIPITINQFNAFNAYINKIKFGIFL